MGWINWFFLAAGIGLVIFYKIRGGSFSRLVPDAFPELSVVEFEALCENLESSNQRMLALALTILLLAVSPLAGYGPAFDNAAMAVTIVLFFYNLPPRHRAMRIIFEKGVERSRFRRLGIWL